MLSNSVANKKGKREGTTVVAHSSSPILAALILVVENKIKQAIKEHKIKGIIVFFNEISIKLNFFVNISQHLLKILILIKVSIYVLNLENIE